MVNTSALALGVALFASIVAFLYNPFVLRLQTVGVFRQWKGFENIHGEGLTGIPDLFGVEDLHFHEPTGIVFGVTEHKAGTRETWFPPMCNFKNSTDLGQGSFFMLFPDEDHATHLSFSNWDSPFVTHGFDIVTSPTDDESIYFIAINHLPNPASILSHPDVPQARSQIELFHYQIGSQEVTHLRSIQHPLIRTPNDIFAITPTTFYFTNDHHTREASFTRILEDIGGDDFGAWSDLIYISIDPSALDFPDPTTGITATIALSGLQNPNGLGHSRYAGEIILTRSAAGILNIVGPSPDPNAKGKLSIQDRLRLPSSIDNPFYFHDPYSQETGRDASGFVLAGLANAIAFPDKAQNPSVVWLVQPPSKSGDKDEVAAMMREKKPLAEWEQKCIFMDDGLTVNTASTAILVAIPPGENGGRKQAWLLVAGPMAVGVWRTKVDL